MVLYTEKKIVYKFKQKTYPLNLNLLQQVTITILLFVYVPNTEKNGFKTNDVLHFVSTQCPTFRSILYLWFKFKSELLFYSFHATIYTSWCFWFTVLFFSFNLYSTNFHLQDNLFSYDDLFFWTYCWTSELYQERIFSGRTQQYAANDNL